MRAGALRSLCSAVELAACTAVFPFPCTVFSSNSPQPAMEACSNGQAALRRERCPSQSLQRAVLQLLQRAEELGASSRAQEVTAEGLRELREQAAPLLRSLTSALQRVSCSMGPRRRQGASKALPPLRPPRPPLTPPLTCTASNRVCCAAV